MCGACESMIAGCWLFRMPASSFECSRRHPGGFSFPEAMLAWAGEVVRPFVVPPSSFPGPRPLPLPPLAVCVAIPLPLPRPSPGAREPVPTSGWRVIEASPRRVFSLRRCFNTRCARPVKVAFCPACVGARDGCAVSESERVPAASPVCRCARWSCMARVKAGRGRRRRRSCQGTAPLRRHALCPDFCGIGPLRSCASSRGQQAGPSLGVPVTQARPMANAYALPVQGSVRRSDAGFRLRRARAPLCPPSPRRAR